MKRAVVVAAVLVILLSGCSSVDDLVDEAMGGGVIHNNGNQTSANAITVGDCLNDRLSDAEQDDFDEGVTSIPVVPCAEPHASEVFKAFFLHGSEYPGERSIFDEADTTCETAFEGYVGIPYADSIMSISYYTPTEASWNNGDREVSCILYEWDLDAEAGVDIVGSLEGAKR